jgi:transposase
MSPAAELIATPHDPEARYTNHRGKVWTGYRVHLTERCQPNQPHLITHVETTPATTADVTVLADIHAGLKKVDLLPDTHLVDQGYTSLPNILTSQTDYGLHLIGPVAEDRSWQAHQAEGLTADQFQIDWQQHRAICPEGQVSIIWSEATSRNQPVIHIQFAQSACAPCPCRSRCTTATTQGRALKLSPDFETLQAARHFQQTEAFQKAYAQRAGMEGTISVSVRQHGLRVSRYVGQSKTHLQALLTATAINLKRAALWLREERPHPSRPPNLQCLSPA